MKTIDMGNNETKSIGVVETEGGFLALTLSQSRTFKTRRGAEAWLSRRGYSPTGERIDGITIDMPGGPVFFAF